MKWTNLFSATLLISAAFAGNNYTPAQIAMQHWFTPNQGIVYPSVFSPRALAFDGSSVWVAGMNVVQKIQPSSGAVLATVSLPAAPQAMLFDGQSLWLANYTDNSVTRVRTTDLNVTKFPLPNCLINTALAFDGTNVYTNCGNSQAIMQIPIANPPAAVRIPVPVVPISLTADATGIWLGGGDDTLTHYTNGVQNAQVHLAGAQGVMSLAFDGTNVFAMARGTGALYMVTPGAQGTVNPLITIGGMCWALVYDGNAIWVANELAPTVYRVTLPNGAPSVQALTTPGNPMALVFDGADVWAAISGTNQLQKF